MHTLRHGLLALLVALAITGCGEADRGPDPSSPEYVRAVSAFYSGLAAVQVGENLLADQYLEDFTSLAPGEPAGWANRGVIALRQGKYDEAADFLATARELAPQNGTIQYLSGILAWNGSDYEEARSYLRAAAERMPENPMVLFALAQLLEQDPVEGEEAEIAGLMDQLVAVEPLNMAVLAERARLAAEEDPGAAATWLDRLEEQSAAWPAEVRAQLEAAQAAAARGERDETATYVTFLRNVFKRLPTYREHLARLVPPGEQRSVVINHLLVMQEPSPTPAPHDTALAYEEVAFPGVPVPAEPASVAALFLRDEGAPTTIFAGADGARIGPDVRVALPGGGEPLPSRGIAGLDYDYDFRTDVTFAGPGGLRFFRQTNGDGAALSFEDVTRELGLPTEVIRGSYTGAWAADLDLEGDVDLILGQAEGAPVVLRNRGDGTFAPHRPFPGVAGPAAFAWADLDADGDPDAALIGAEGTLHVFSNERSQGFREMDAPNADRALALVATDVDSDGQMDLMVLSTDGALQRFSYDRVREAWTEALLARWEALEPPVDPAHVHLLAADLDNNGALDMAVSSPAGSQVYLHGAEGRFHAAASLPDVRVVAATSFTGEGHLDLVGLSAEGHPVRLAGSGATNYLSKSVRPRAVEAPGDQRINSFGIGGEVEVRTGLLFQKQPIGSPVVHFGLGEHARIDVVRIIWPNGIPQAEFDLASDEVIRTQQRLKGSCPWVFTYDGEEMTFVTDFIWRSPLGLRINAQETAGIMATEDWVKIDGEELVPRDGYYDVRITAELWETHFFDHVSLLVVDHPDSVDVFVDERFAFPPPALEVHPVAPLLPVARARDDAGRDVTELVREVDERYLGTFRRGPYQGIAEDHYVEVELPEAALGDGPLVLAAAGWVRPTDSSINVAISQGDHAPPTSLSLEVPDGRSGWTTVRENLGFPSGKHKTILIDLDGVFQPGMRRTLRLRTNLEVYWDAIGWTVRRPVAALRKTRLTPTTAELRYRGYSVVTEADRQSPEIPHYDRLTSTTQIWRDLEGYYTRFGDVRELLHDIDDRYVIMNAGDEMRFRFPAQPPPPEGWTRDFVLMGDGWVKDGDYNTSFSTTVRPLPLHDDPAYDTPPGPLEDDPAYRRHPDDWKTYHTRYVAPTELHQRLAVER